MAQLYFEITHEFDASSREVWDTLVDWQAHGEWIPATRMEVEPGDPTAVGATFTGLTGYGPLMLEDRMSVTRCDWDEAARSGDCEVAKLGPVLVGRAWFTVRPHAAGAEVRWYEDVTLRYVPQFLAPIVNRLAAGGFSLGMRKLAKLLRSRS